MKKILVGILCLLFLLPFGLGAASLVHKFYDVQILHNLIVDNVLFADNAVIDNLTITGTLTEEGAAAYRGALVYNEAGTSVANETETLIPFTGESYDTDNTHSITTDNAYIIIPAGVTKIRLYGQVTMSGGTIHSMIVRLYKNGTMNYAGAGFIDVPTDNTTLTTAQIYTPTIDVTANDNICMKVWQNSGELVSVTGSAYGSLTWLAMDIVQ